MGIGCMLRVYVERVLGVYLFGADHGRVVELALCSGGWIEDGGGGIWGGRGIYGMGWDAVGRGRGEWLGWVMRR